MRKIRNEDRLSVSIDLGTKDGKFILSLLKLTGMELGVSPTSGMMAIRHGMARYIGEEQIRRFVLKTIYRKIDLNQKSITIKPRADGWNVARAYIDDRTEVGLRALAELIDCKLPIEFIPSSGSVEIHYGIFRYLGVGQIREFVKWTQTLRDKKKSR